MNTVKYLPLKHEAIVVHCSATPADMDIGVEDIEQWHKQRGFLSVGYHYVIRRDGTLEVGRDINTPGAHVRGHNDYTVGVCLVGGVNKRNQPTVNYTDEQYEALFGILTSLLINYETIVDIKGHNELDPRKACPCFDVPSWVQTKAPLTQLLESRR